MKKIILAVCLMFLFGCETLVVDNRDITTANPQINNDIEQPKETIEVNCQTNMDNLWNEYVTKNDIFVLKNRTSENLTEKTKETFTNLNCEISNLRKFFILGGEFDDPGEDNPIKKKGLMKIADNDNEVLVNQLKKTLELINGNGEEKSLLSEAEEFKEGIKNVCDRQKVPYKCDL